MTHHKRPRPVTKQSKAEFARALTNVSLGFLNTIYVHVLEVPTWHRTAILQELIRRKNS